MSFVDNLRDVQESEKTSKEKNQAAAKARENFYKTYQDNNNRHWNGSQGEFNQRFDDMIGRLGVEDGTWTQEEYDEGLDYDDRWNDYVINFVKDTMGDFDEDGSLSINKEKYDSIPDDVKAAYDRMQKYGNEQWGTEALDKRVGERYADNINLWDDFIDGWATTGDAIGSGIATLWNSPYNDPRSGGSTENEKSWVADNALVTKYLNEKSAEALDIFDNYEDYIEKVKAQKAEAESNKKESGSESESESNAESNTESNTNSSSDDGTTGEEVVLTVKPGDTFGQMLLDNGLVTDKGLWGPDGDVEFYTKQLNDANHMNLIYPGQAIRLKRRK